jgi:hypothetical protein
MEDDIQDEGKDKIFHNFGVTPYKHYVHFPARRSFARTPSERRRFGACEWCRTFKMRCDQYSTGQACSRCRGNGRVCSLETSPEENDTRTNRDSALGEPSRELWTSRKCIKAHTQDVDA